jgi:tol-pal system protein YbgF
MNLSARFLAIVSLVCLPALLFSCSSSSNAARGNADNQQSEQDILRLLGVEGDAAVSEGTRRTGGASEQGSMEYRVTELENLLLDKESEINELKAELVLKEERLDDFSGGRPTNAPASSISQSSSFQAQYDQALSLYRSGQYERAIQEFQRLLSINMTHSLSDNCQYWTGESYYGLKNFRQAVIEFEKVFTFAKSNKDPDAQLKLGLCYKNLGDNEKARMEYNRLLTNFPNSEYAPKARQLLARLP